MAQHAHAKNNETTVSKRMELDTAATMFPLAFCDKQRSLVYLTATMNESVDLQKLQLALNRLITRFPSFYVRLCHDKSGFFFEKMDRAPVICEAYEENKTLFLSLDDLLMCAFRVVVAENSITLVYFHAISDGFGGSVFLKSLIAEYLHIRYAISVPWSEDILCANDGPNSEEIKDAYLDIVGGSSKSNDLSNSYSIIGTSDEKLHITELTLKTGELLRCACEYGVSLTALLSGILTTALFDLQRHENRGHQEIRLSIPVDLRKRFRSITLRNFSILVTVNAGKEKTPLHALCQSFDKQLKGNLSNENLSAIATSYVRLARNKVFAILPLFLKRWMVQMYFSLSQSVNCMTFSNLGVWQIPDDMKPYVERCSMVFSPKPTAPYSCGVVTVGNTLTLTLARNIKEPLLEARVLHVLKGVILNT
jgi:NRPS condensation-like uncharacterized protein